MNLKQIIQTGFFIGGLALAVNGFADANLPKVHANQLKSVWYNPESISPETPIKNLLHLGYDTNQDNQPDIAFKYELSKLSAFDWEEKTDLVEYAVDKNKDGEFSEDEWVKYKPAKEESDFNGKKRDLLKINPERLVTHVWNLPCKDNFSNNALDLGYDINADGLEDSRFFYSVLGNSSQDNNAPPWIEDVPHWVHQTITPTENMEAVANLVSYIIDQDFDGFDENEWSQHIPKEEQPKK